MSEIGVTLGREEIETGSGGFVAFDQSEIARFVVPGVTLGWEQRMPPPLVRGGGGAPAPNASHALV